MNLEVRPFDEADRASVIDLWVETGLTRPWNDPSLDIDRKVALGDSLFLVAVAESGVVGTVMAGYDGHRGWINYLGVALGQQGTGLGQRMMAEAEDRLVSLGCPKINLQIRSENVAVQEFYRRLGYLPDDVVSMGKRLVVDEPAG